MKNNRFFTPENNASVYFCQERQGYFYKANGKEIPFQVVMNTMFFESKLLKNYNFLAKAALKLIQLMTREKETGKNSPQRRGILESLTLQRQTVLNKVAARINDFKNLEAYVKTHNHEKTN